MIGAVVSEEVLAEYEEIHTEAEEEADELTEVTDPAEDEVRRLEEQHAKAEARRKRQEVRHIIGAGPENLMTCKLNSNSDFYFNLVSW